MSLSLDRFVFQTDNNFIRNMYFCLLLFVRLEIPECIRVAMFGSYCNYYTG